MHTIKFQNTSQNKYVILLEYSTLKIQINFNQRFNNKKYIVYLDWPILREKIILHIPPNNLHIKD